MISSLLRVFDSCIFLMEKVKKLEKTMPTLLKVRGDCSCNIPKNVVDALGIKPGDLWEVTFNKLVRNVKDKEDDTDE